jgi:hypothetical protein
VGDGLIPAGEEPELLLIHDVNLPAPLLLLLPLHTRNRDHLKGREPVLQIRIRIRIHRIQVFLGLLDPDPVRGMDPDPDSAPDPSIITQKW